MAILTSREVQAAILKQLRHGTLNLWEIAAAIDEPPFRVRGELRGPLRRDQLVRERRVGREAGWTLTDRGVELAWQSDQLELLR